MQPDSLINFPVLFYARFQVWRMSPVDIDRMLENGWFRNDRHVQMTQGRFVDHIWKSAVMLRIPLEQFQFKKRLRKRLRQNNELFDVRIRPFVPRKEMEELWSRFKLTKHQWKKVPLLTHHLFKGLHYRSFHTYEVSVYDGDRLIAFSLFDRGNSSLASLEAAYDLNYARHSLGLYTMLLEIEYGKNEHLSHYYPGFYPKDTPMFDYKLRPGHLQFFSVRKSSWLPMDDLSDKDWLLDEVFEKLRKVAGSCRPLGYSSRIIALNELSYPDSTPSSNDYNFQLYIEKGPAESKTDCFEICWDPLKACYLLFKRKPAEEPELGNAVDIDWKRSDYIGMFETMDALMIAVKQKC